MSVETAIGFLAGALLMRGITYISAMWRQCCREHYATHADCPCRDCKSERRK